MDPETSEMMEVADKVVKTYMSMFHMVQNEKKHMNKMRKEMEVNGISRDEQVKYLRLKIHRMGLKCIRHSRKKEQ